MSEKREEEEEEEMKRRNSSNYRKGKRITAFSNLKTRNVK